MIEQRGNSLFFSIQDDGNITPEDHIQPGFGLTGIAERIKQLNGSLSYFAKEPHGFRLDVTLPIEHLEKEGSMRT